MVKLGIQTLDGSNTKWALPCITWTMTEKVRPIAPRCTTHAEFEQLRHGGRGAEPSVAGVEGKVRTVGRQSIHGGWQVGGKDRPLELSLRVAPYMLSSGRFRRQKVVCLVDNVSEHAEVTHSLSVILIMYELPGSGGSAGVGRVMQIKLPVVIAEDADGIIDWVDEVPPAYSDHASSPPPYDHRL
ncbi:hypothetical protein ACCO45_009891 [Purpureocillium lilacinum]|uniref:Uncharacterized protein n=2 Tax=Purpureocillium lilacinum TaxID=33203 RepID=A0ACC4DJ06_PURLI